MNEATPPLFRLGPGIAGDSPVMRGLWKLMEQPVTRLLGLDAVNDIYLRTLADDRARPQGRRRGRQLLQRRAGCDEAGL